MEILTSVKRLYISFKSPVNDFVYSFGRAALLLNRSFYAFASPSYGILQKSSIFLRAQVSENELVIVCVVLR